MNQAIVTIGVGVVLIIAALLAKGIGYGMPPHRTKPVYPATRRVRVILFSFGLFTVVLGILEFIRRPSSIR